MVRSTIIVCLCLFLALVASVIAAPGRERRYYDGGYNLGGGYGGGIAGYGGHGGHGHGYGLVPQANTQTFSKSQSSASSVSSGVALG